MGTLSHVLHTGARPIGLHEFIDAVQAACPPRFPRAKGILPRPVALAISGGVDSMALAFLCSQLRAQLRLHDPSFKVSDNPVSSFRALIIDHGLREGSRSEGEAVCAALRNMGIKSDLFTLSWSKVLSGSGQHPSHLSNLESVARRLRYRRLGEICASRRVASLLLAHHADDQYETVLMRLLQGHGSRGLRGMKKATDIPECEGIFGASQSGYVDDQYRPDTFCSNTISKRECKSLRRELRSNIHSMTSEVELDEDALAELEHHAPGFNCSPEQKHSVEPVDIDVEDGGVFVYRPLLEFSKDRLIATCLENKIPWWEDHTNQDATLTMRNAVRHLYKGYILPVALQKPAILALSKKCEQKAQTLDAEANRLVSRTIIHEFGPNIGTLTVQFPNYGPLRSRRYSKSPLRRQACISRQREVAGLLIQKIIALVTPELQSPPLVNLQNVISRLFPALADSQEAKLPGSAKAFNISGIHFIPVQLDSQQASSASGMSKTERSQLSWFLSRAPYPSTQPIPRFRTPYWAIANKHHRWKWSLWIRWALWDGRFWFRIMHRLPYRVIVQPFFKEHAKPFRELLLPGDRSRLAILLKRYAPGKVRYTLPALYLEEDLDLNNVVPRPGYPRPLPLNTNGNNNGKTSATIEGQAARDGTSHNYSHPKVLDISKMKLIALPTLGMQIPRLEEWLIYQVRYKRADRGTLETAGKYYRSSFARSKSSLVSKPKPRKANLRTKVRVRVRVGMRKTLRIALSRRRGIMTRTRG
ncbi:adenine nucleotide alpha hydrolases-like protein [Biscogniauxia marginata]|nr:adenine nucleotide alpha hydrolases-like protein [Biscogniauxia marginata]